MSGARGARKSRARRSRADAALSRPENRAERARLRRQRPCAACRAASRIGSDETTMDPQRPAHLLTAIATGLKLRCPRCGRGRLFAGFLTVAPKCEACGLDFDFADSGDGPAVFVTLIGGFIVLGHRARHRHGIRAAVVGRFRDLPAAGGHRLPRAPAPHEIAADRPAILDEGGAPLMSAAARGAPNPLDRRRGRDRDRRGDPHLARRLAVAAAAMEGGADRRGRGARAWPRLSPCPRPTPGPRSRPTITNIGTWPFPASTTCLARRSFFARWASRVGAMADPAIS